jgi:hypothetical protein
VSSAQAKPPRLISKTALVAILAFFATCLGVWLTFAVLIGHALGTPPSPVSDTPQRRADAQKQVEAQCNGPAVFDHVEDDAYVFRLQYVYAITGIGSSSVRCSYHPSPESGHTPSQPVP